MNSDIFMLIALFRSGGSTHTHSWPELFSRSLLYRNEKFFNYDLIIRRRTITVITIPKSTSTFFSNKAIAMHKILFAD